jgi:hypothetical protein
MPCSVSGAHHGMPPDVTYEPMYDNAGQFRAGTTLYMVACSMPAIELIHSWYNVPGTASAGPADVPKLVCCNTIVAAR